MSLKNATFFSQIRARDKQFYDKARQLMDSGFDLDAHALERWISHIKWCEDEIDKSSYQFVEMREQFLGGFCPSCRKPFMSFDIPGIFVGVCWDCKESKVIEIGGLQDLPIVRYAENILIYHACKQKHE